MSAIGKGGASVLDAADSEPSESFGEVTNISSTAVLPIISSPESAGLAIPNAGGSRRGGTIPRCRLVVISGREAGRSFTAAHEHVLIGSHPPSDIVLSDPTVSRFHCEITLGEQSTIRDLGSRNRTLVNGVPVVQAILDTNAVLQLGETQLRFQYEPGELEIPLSSRTQFGNLVGRSRGMRAVFAALEQAAASEATVLVEGDTGTGKEGSAEGIHRESRRRNKPFIVVDCASLPPQLLESELFGHEKGSFTGALGARVGAFEEANGGTVFLDEIGELTLDLQPKLLRVLERKEIKRVGSNIYKPVDVRLVAATNRNLRAEVTARRFRSDLYYRLAVVVIRLPPLRERLDDIPILVDHILESLGVQDQPESETLRSDAFLSRLRGYSWQGNVRELRNHVERCVVMPDRSGGMPLTLDEGHHAPSGEQGASAEIPISTHLPLKIAREEWVNKFERHYLAAVLENKGNNVTAAARAAGVNRIHFYRLLWKHGLRRHGDAE